MFLNVQGGANSDAADNSPPPILGNFVPPEEDRGKDKSASKDAISAVKATYEAVGVNRPIESSIKLSSEVMDASISGSAAIPSQKMSTSQLSLSEVDAEPHDVSSKCTENNLVCIQVVCSIFNTYFCGLSLDLLNF